jgi:hypothetical protein
MPHHDPLLEQSDLVSRGTGLQADEARRQVLEKSALPGHVGVAAHNDRLAIYGVNLEQVLDDIRTDCGDLPCGRLPRVIRRNDHPTGYPSGQFLLLILEFPGIA